MARLYYLKRFSSSRAPRQEVLPWKNAKGIVGEVQAFLRSILSDGILNETEASSLHQLLLSNSALIEQIGFPLSDLLRRVSQFASDGVWSPNELKSLQSQLEALAAGMELDTRPPAPISARDIFTSPVPIVKHEGSEFVLTGQFAWGSREQVAKQIELRGGRCHNRPRHSTQYVLVGSFVSEGWIHGNSGRKIEAARDLAAKGHPIRLLSEEHWQKSIQEPGSSNSSILLPSSPPAAGLPIIAAIQGPLAGTTWVITGALSEDRETIADLIRANGGKVSSSVSGKTTYLLAGEDAGSKLDKAKKLNVQILDEPAFRQMLE